MLTNVHRKSVLTNDTARERRTGKPFKGKVLHYAKKIAYKLPGDLKKDQLKFESPSRVGLFMGWHVAPGAKWHGDYLVLDLEHYLENRSAAVIKRVKDIYDIYPLTFPLAEAKEHAAAQRLKKFARERAGDFDTPSIETAEIGIQACPPPPPSQHAHGDDADKGGDKTDDAEPDSQPAPKGYAWQSGRLTRLQKTNRPSWMWPELWKKCSKSEKEQIMKEEATKRAAELAEEEEKKKTTEQAETSFEVARTDAVPDDNAQKMVSMVAKGSQPVGRSQNGSHTPPPRTTVRHGVSEEVKDFLGPDGTKRTVHVTNQYEKYDAELHSEPDFPSGTKRVLMELCTSADSEMGKSAHSEGEVAVVRITLAHDLTTPDGLSYCLSVVRAARKNNLPLCLYISLPCTAGCVYWRIILARHPRAQDKLAHHK